MLSVKKSDFLQVAVGYLPTLISLITVLHNSTYWVLLICAVMLFVIIGVCPLFKKKENLWMFLFVAAASLPVNVRLSLLLFEYGIIESDILWFGVICAILLSCILFSLEEVIFGIVTRLIWRKQDEIKL